MEKEKNKSDKPEAYPQPSKEDTQYRNQPEFIGEKPSDFKDQRVSDKPSLKEDENRNNKE